MTDLEKARLTINEVDTKMAALFEERMHAAKVVAEYKRLHGLQVTDPVREAQLIARNRELIKDEALKGDYVNFLQHTMDISKNYQHRILEGMRVAFSGVKGAFAHIAANKIFPDAVAVPYGDFKAAYNAVVSGECDCAVLPVENSFNGDVSQVMDLAFFGNLYINGIYDIGVTQNLLGVKGATIEDVKTVISHPQALGQCADYIRAHNLETIESVNTAVAAKQVAAANDKSLAAIGSEEAAKEFGLIKLESHINESNANTTRFAVFTRVPKTSREDKHFIMLFTVKNEAGALGKAISIIGNNGFNLKALKSRPTKELIWSYYFYAEGEGNIEGPEGQKMLNELKTQCNEIKVVGKFEKEISL